MGVAGRATLLAPHQGGNGAAMWGIFRHHAGDEREAGGEAVENRPQGDDGGGENGDSVLYGPPLDALSPETSPVVTGR